MPAVSSHYIIVKKWGYGSYGAWGVTLIDTVPTTPLKRGDVLAFRFSNDEPIIYIKRVVGLPGDKISFSEDKLLVNGKAVKWGAVSMDDLGVRTIVETLDDETYSILIHQNPIRIKQGPWKVPERRIFVLGDNRHRSNDSRYWKYVPTKNIVGKLITVY